jgi:hypothetical protein
MPSASLSQYASLSLVVRGRGHGAMPLEVGGALRLRLEAEGRFEILDWRCAIRDVGSQQAKCGLNYISQISSVPTFY